MSGESAAAAAVTTNPVVESPTPTATALHSGERTVSAFTPEVNATEILERAKAAYGLPINDDDSAASGGSSERTPAADDDKDKGKSKNKDKPPAVDKPAADKPLDAEALRSLAKDGKFTEILEQLGVDPEGLNIPSSRFAEFRKQQKKAEERIAAREDTLRKRDAEFQTVLSQALSQVEPLTRAKELYEKGDVVGALSKAFGDKFETVMDHALRQQSGKDPELISLRRKEEQREREAKEQREREAQHRSTAAQRAKEAQYVSQLSEEFKTLGGGLEAAAEIQGLSERVMRYQLDQYNAGKDVPETEQALRSVLTETAIENHNRVGKVLARLYPEKFRGVDATGGAQASANTDRTGRTSSNTDPAGRSPELGKGRKGLPVSRVGATPTKRPEEMSREELIQHFSGIMRDEQE